ncbi:COMM domain containing 10 [Pelomyxa schiedti]|nr:COMM domain containing 10 [Pelomyxa schiedti]
MASGGASGTTAAQGPFNMTERFQSAIEIVNAIPREKFPDFMTRIVRRMQQTDESNMMPLEQLAERAQLGIAAADGTAAAEACTYIVEQAAYYTFSLQVLTDHLRRIGLQEDKVVGIVTAWKQGSAVVLERLRSGTLAPLALQSVDWRLHLQLANQGASRVNAPTALFKFTLADDTDPAVKNNTNDVMLEFSTDELSQFYLKLEKIQEQLDNLS